MGPRPVARRCSRWRRALRGLAGVGVLGAADGCEPAPAAAHVPAFAAELPGGTLAVVWGEGGRQESLELPRELLQRLSLEARRVGDVAEAWVGKAPVAWPSLAANASFAAACGEALPGDRLAFVDLQQVVDLLAASTRSGAGAAPGQGLQAMVAQRVLDALGLRGLQWLVASERSVGGRREWRGVLAADAGSSALRLLEPRSATGLPASWPVAGADVVGTIVFSPSTAVGVLRDLLSGDEGPAQMVRELLRGPRFRAALAALAALSGTAAVALGEGGAWVALGMADPTAVGDALDAVAQGTAAGWTMFGWNAAIDGSCLVWTRGEPSPTRQPLPEPHAGMWLQLPARGLEVTASRDDRAARLLFAVRELPPSGR